MFLLSYSLAVLTLLVLLVGLGFFSLLEKRALLLSLISLESLFAFAFVAHAPMMCILLGTFGANALLLQLIYPEEKKSEFQNPHKNGISSLKWFQVVTRLGVLGVGGAPLLSWLCLSFWDITVFRSNSIPNFEKATPIPLTVLLIGVISLSLLGTKISLRSGPRP